MRPEQRPGSPLSWHDDQLATAAVSLVVGELQWTPDLAPEVMDRISRDAVAYPEQFDRRPAPAMQASNPEHGARSAKRTMGRLAVFGVLFIVSIALVVLVATTNAAASGPVHGAGVAHLPIGAISGTLVTGGGQIVPAVTEAS